MVTPTFALRPTQVTATQPAPDEAHLAQIGAIGSRDAVGGSGRVPVGFPTTTCNTWAC